MATIDIGWVCDTNLNEVIRLNTCLHILAAWLFMSPINALWWSRMPLQDSLRLSQRHVYLSLRTLTGCDLYDSTTTISTVATTSDTTAPREWCSASCSACMLQTTGLALSAACPVTLSGALPYATTVTETLSTSLPVRKRAPYDGTMPLDDLPQSGSVTSDTIEQQRTWLLRQLENAETLDFGGDDVFSEAYTYPRQPMNYIVQGLFGCTATLIMTNTGAALIHMFESPGFRDPQNPLLENNLPDTDPRSFASVTLFGLNAWLHFWQIPGQLLADYMGTSTFIYTVTPQVLDDGGVLMYPQKARRIISMIQSILGQAASYKLVTYVATNAYYSQGVDALFGKAILQWTPLQRWVKIEQRDAQGNTVGYCSSPRAKIALYVQGVLTFQQEFVSTSNQFNIVTASAQRRDMDSALQLCEVANSSSSMVGRQTTTMTASAAGSTSNFGPGAGVFSIITAALGGVSAAGTGLAVATSDLANLKQTGISSATTSTTALALSPLCVPFDDPDHGGQPFCQCEGSDLQYSLVSSSLCPYTAPYPTSAVIGGVSTPVPTTTMSAVTVTTTYLGGLVQACTTFSSQAIAGLPVSICQGPVLASPTPPPQAYATGTCRLHLAELYDNCNADLLSAYQILDNSDSIIDDGGDRTSTIAWGGTQSIPSVKLGFGNLTLFWDNSTSTIGYSTKHRRSNITTLSTVTSNDLAGPVPIKNCNPESNAVHITYDQTTWWSNTTNDGSKTVPYCNVGGWDNGDFGDWLAELAGLGPYLTNRQMDCFFIC